MLLLRIMTLCDITIYMHNILSVMRLEVGKSRSVIDRRIVIFMIATALISALAVPFMDISTFSMTKGLYLVRVDSSPLETVRADKFGWGFAA